MTDFDSSSIEIRNSGKRHGRFLEEGIGCRGNSGEYYSRSIRLRSVEIHNTYGLASRNRKLSSATWDDCGVQVFRSRFSEDVISGAPWIELDKLVPYSIMQRAKFRAISLQIRYKIIPLLSWLVAGFAKRWRQRAKTYLSGNESGIFSFTSMACVWLELA